MMIRTILSKEAATVERVCRQADVMVWSGAGRQRADVLIVDVPSLTALLDKGARLLTLGAGLIVLIDEIESPATVAMIAQLDAVPLPYDSLDLLPRLLRRMAPRRRAAEGAFSVRREATAPGERHRASRIGLRRQATTAALAGSAV